MDVKGRELGPDDAEAVVDLPSLDELAKIDRDRYSIVGIDVRVDGPTTAIATVYAIDRLEQSVLSIRLRDRPTLGSWARAAVRFLPVVEFGLPEPNVEEFITQASTRSS
jgi:hypothetical protein